jgi:hypothetical protein
MGRCPWHGEVCDCGLGWPYPVNGLMPQRCEDRTPLYMGSIYRAQFSAEKRKEYDDWVKAGQPRLGPDDDEQDASNP